ncbi:MAG TPA: ATP-binding cassette domain-containing protein, partial [Symbiobacteriaceae bacterium]|nr:ATP-binding cassette domain-containing protein [Symbiobacteriaceae bacterium]
MTPALEFQNLFVQFNRRKAEPLIAVAGLTLGMEPGQVYALLGPNGSGKTTTVNVACGLLRPASGTVRVHGIDVTADVAAVRAILGVVPQETAL